MLTDQIAVERIKQIIIDELANSLVATGAVGEDYHRIFDEDHGISEDPNISARNWRNHVKVWLDSSVDTEQGQSNSHEIGWLQGGIRFQINAIKQDIGKAKREISFAIYYALKKWWMAYLGRYGVFEFKVNTDYRYTSLRSTGGSQRGLVAKSQTTGHLTDAATLVWRARRKIHIPTSLEER